MEEDFALMQQYPEDLLSAFPVSTSEAEATKTKLIATAPLDSGGFMMMLNSFANLLFQLFSFS